MPSYLVYPTLLIAVALFHFIVVKKKIGGDVHILARVFLWAVFSFMVYQLLNLTGKLLQP